MYKRFYKVLSDNGELQAISITASGLNGKIYETSETEYLLILCALSRSSGVIPADGLFAARDEKLKEGVA